MSVAYPQTIYRQQTYTNIFYLLLAFPLGILYFTLLMVGISLSLGTLVLIIGFPLTLLFLLLFRSLARVERNLASNWLHVKMPPMSSIPRERLSWTQMLLLRLGDPLTWKIMGYLFLKFPFGILAFTLVVTFCALMLAFGLVSLVLSLLVAPFVCLVALIRGVDITSSAARRFLLLAWTGFGLFTFPLYLLNGLASLWGMFSRVMLGMSQNAFLLEQAREQAERERVRAEQADKSRRQLIINVSHELRTPVASIRGHVESLMAVCDGEHASLPAPETLYKYLDIVHRESLRLGSLVDDLLSLARSETDELRVNMAAVEADLVVEEVYQTLMPLAKRERQITLVREVAAHLPNVQADRQRLQQVLLNLVRNAITYTPDGGIVSLMLRPAADPAYIELLVADTGMGIAPEEQQHIFDRFYRTDASRSRSSGGFGLGLSIVHDFVKAMGGSITVASKVGEGSCFSVLLRVA